MSNLFTSKAQNKEVELSIGTAYVKPLMLKDMTKLESVLDKDASPILQATNFSMILKDVLVDADGNGFDDLNSMKPEELSNALPVGDFTKLVQAMSPEVYHPNEL